MTLVFVDTTIIAYARDARDRARQPLAERWLSVLARHRAGRLSWQVLGEFYRVATHPRKLGMAAELARADVLALQTWNPVAPDGQLFESAWALSDHYGFAWRDALVVAAARRCGCQILLSEDLQHDLLVEDALRIVNPFAPGAPEPESVAAP